MTSGPVLRDQGHQQVLGHSPEWWVSCCRTALDHLARSGRAFTSDDLAALGVPAPHHPNAVGAVFRTEALAGRIVQCGWAESRRPEAHGRVIRQWIGTAA